MIGDKRTNPNQHKRRERLARAVFVCECARLPALRLGLLFNEEVLTTECDATIELHCDLGRLNGGRLICSMHEVSKPSADPFSIKSAARFSVHS